MANKENKFWSDFQHLLETAKEGEIRKISSQIEQVELEMLAAKDIQTLDQLIQKREVFRKDIARFDYLYRSLAVGGSFRAFVDWFGPVPEECKIPGHESAYKVAIVDLS